MNPRVRAVGLGNIEAGPASRPKFFAVPLPASSVTLLMIDTMSMAALNGYNISTTKRQPITCMHMRLRLRITFLCGSGVFVPGGSGSSLLLYAAANLMRCMNRSRAYLYFRIAMSGKHFKIWG
jgi:hypothetical protein